MAAAQPRRALRVRRGLGGRYRHQNRPERRQPGTALQLSRVSRDRLEQRRASRNLFADRFGLRHQMTSRSAPRYTGVRTFAGLEHVGLDRLVDAGADAVVVGVPFDTATSWRPGARFGPE